MLAPVEKKAVTLRVSLTDRCQLRCIYCKPEKAVKSCSHDDILSFDEIMEFVRFLQRQYGLSKVHLTGGDPLNRAGIADLIAMLSDAGVADIALTTNAQLLGRHVDALHKAGLKRINISLDSLNPDTFKHMSRGGELSRTLEGIDAALECGIQPVKLNTVVLKTINEHEVLDIARFSLARNCQVRFLELMPIGVSSEYFKEWFVPSSAVMKTLEMNYEFHQKHAKTLSSSRNYEVKSDSGACGTIGFISPSTAPFCSGCRRLRLSSDGRLLGCLAQNMGLNLRTITHGDSCLPSAMLDAVDSALKIKRKKQKFDTDMAMVSIGG